MCSDGSGSDNDVPIRTVPALVTMGLLSHENGVHNIKTMLSVTDAEAEQLLSNAMIQDKWIADEVTKLERKDRL